MYGPTPSPAGRYSPAECTGIKKVRVEGNPDEKHVSTSFVEVHNKTMRMHMRRFTRLTNGHSKKVANHAHMVALYTLFYNFIRTHGKLRMSPAMAAGIATTFLSFEDVLARIDAAQAPSSRALEEASRLERRLSLSGERRGFLCAPFQRLSGELVAVEPVTDELSHLLVLLSLQATFG
jgi:hypothetical protein